MSSKAFEIAAAVMSYWFAAVMVYLLLRLLLSQLPLLSLLWKNCFRKR